MPAESSNLAYVTDGVSLWEVPTSEVGRLNPKTHWVPSSAEVEEMRARKFASTRGQQAISFAEGVGSGLTLGVSTLAQKNLGSADHWHRSQARAEHADVARAAGEVVGAVAPTLATGGQSAVAQGLAKAPAGMLARGAVRAGAAAEKALVKRGNQLVAKTAGRAVEGATEGSGALLAHAATDASLGDEELTAEKVFASLGSGAFLGGAFGGAIGAGGHAFSRGRKALANRGRKALAAGKETVETAGETVGDAAAGGTGALLPNKLDSALTKLQAGLSGGDESLLRRAGVTQHGPEAREIRRASISKQANTERYTREATEAPTMVQETDRLLRDVAAGELKAKNVARTVKRGPETIERAKAYANQFRDQVYSATSQMKDKGRIKKMRAWADSLVSSQEELIKKGGKNLEADLFVGLDNTRRAFWQYSKASARSAQRSANPDQMILNEATRDIAADVAGTAKQFLEDADTWGQAATNQARRNKAFTENLNFKGDFDSRFARRTRERESADRWQYNRFIVDPGKVKRGIQNFGKAEADFDTQSTKEFLRTRRDLIDAVIEGGEVTGKELDQLKAARRATIDAEDVFERANRDLGVAEALEEQIKNEQGGGLSAITGAVGGGLVGGPVGALAGAAVGLLTQPGAMMRRLAVIESIGQKVLKTDSKIADGLRQFMRNSAKRHESKPSGVKALSRKSERRRVPLAASAAAVFGSTHETRRNRYERQRQKIESFVADPVLALNHIQQQVTRGAGSDAPRVVPAAVQQHARVIKFLHDKLPRKSEARSRSLQPHLVKQSVSPTDLEQFAKYYRTATNPLSVLDDLESGRVTSEAVETIKTVYPKLFQDLRERTMLALAETRKQLAHSDVLNLSILFDFVGDSTLDPGFISRQQERISQGVPAQEQQSPAAGAAYRSVQLDVAKDLQTHAQGIGETL